MSNRRVNKVLKIITIMIISIIVYLLTGYTSSRIDEGGLWLVACFGGWFWCLFGWIGALLLVLNDD